MKIIRANHIDIYSEEIYPAEISIKNGVIKSIKKVKGVVKNFILPGFIDAHIHIESCMVSPLEFSKVAVSHGSIGAISDPHEIANVLGMEGIMYMLENAKKTPFKFLFGAPSCVPATEFESSGAILDSKAIEKILKLENIGFLSEMMNYPGVINGDKEVLEKINVSQSMGFPIDGHAPGLMGKDLEKYAAAGISTDHECFTYEEALQKIELGMKILIREGSGAKNFDALIPLLKEHPDKVMFCTDDLHPDDLMVGHINLLVKRAIDLGYNMFDSIRAGGFLANKHYNLKTGMLKENDPADFILIDTLENWKILSTYINGNPVFNDGSIFISGNSDKNPNVFNIEEIEDDDLKVHAKGEKIKIIQVIDGELITKKTIDEAPLKNELVVAEPSKDILKLVVINRYQNTKPAVGFIRGFNLQQGAIASSIGHDSHNIICVGTDDRSITNTVNWIIRKKGGIAVQIDDEIQGMELEIAGIMSSRSVEEVAKAYSKISMYAKNIGCTLKAPLMTLSFMALLVIPELKLSDKGLFDGKTFSFTSIFDED
jgi:adenine deaminase